MKKHFSYLLSFLIVISSFSILTGCNNTPDPKALSMVLGVHKYFPKISLMSDKIYDKIYDTCYSYGNVSVVAVDGKPSISANYSIPKPDKDINEGKKKQLAKLNTENIINECSDIKAVTPEIDLLSAIRLSADELRSSSAKDKTMIILDSGLSTEGILNNAKADILSGDASIIVEKLEALHAIPDLTNIEVQWMGLGDVIGEQNKIPYSYEYNLRTLWEAIIVAGGGDVIFNSEHLSGDEAENLPDCKTVYFPQDILDIDFSSEKVLVDPIKIDERTIKFVENKSEFVNSKKAKNALKPISDILVDNPKLKIVIAGTTASVGNLDSSKKLSRERAKACKELLIKNGAKAKQIECIGLGYSDSYFHVDDLDANGNLIEELAKKNRAVYIYSTDSDVAKIL